MALADPQGIYDSIYWYLDMVDKISFELVCYPSHLSNILSFVVRVKFRGILWSKAHSNTQSLNHVLQLHYVINHSKV